MKHFVPFLAPRRRARTANKGDEMRMSAVVSTANVAGIASGEWALIAPYGDHPSPDGSYVQHFHREQAENVVSSFNSLTGFAARCFKNMVHGLGAKGSIPCWDGHPESDKQRWPKERLICETTDLRAGTGGLEGKITWNAKGAERRTRGPLFPSPLWWHWPPAGEPPTVFPELLESVGLVPTPNISGVPAWTANATFADPQSGNQYPAENQSHMNKEQFDALCKALNLPGTTDPAKVIDAATAAFQLNTANAAKLTEKETLLSTANSAKTDLDGKLTTANAQVTTLTGERDTLKTEKETLTTANSKLTTEVETLRKGALDVAEKRGAITPAERPDFATKITANAAGTLTELTTRKAPLNVAPVEINGSRLDLSTANARSEALTRIVQKRMKEESIGYDEAFAAVAKDPAYAALFSAMQPAAA